MIPDDQPIVCIFKHSASYARRNDGEVVHLYQSPCSSSRLITLIVLTMSDKSQRQKGGGRAIAALNMAIDGLNPLKPSQAPFFCFQRLQCTVDVNGGYKWPLQAWLAETSRFFPNLPKGHTVSHRLA